MLIQTKQSQPKVWYLLYEPAVDINRVPSASRLKYCICRLVLKKLRKIYSAVNLPHLSGSLHGHVIPVFPALFITDSCLCARGKQVSSWYFLFNFLLSLLLPVIFVNVQLFPLHINLKRVYPSVDVWALFWSEFLLTKTVQYIDYRNTVSMDANTASTLTRIPTGDYYTVTFCISLPFRE